MPMTDTSPLDLIKRLADALHDAADDVEGWGNYASSYFQEKHDLSGNVARVHAQAEEARAYLSAVAQPQISEEENERRFRECLRIIQNTSHEELVELMGEEFLEEFRRVSQR
jgi:hypothetical protein